MSKLNIKLLIDPPPQKKKIDHDAFVAIGR